MRFAVLTRATATAAFRRNRLPGGSADRPVRSGFAVPIERHEPHGGSGCRPFRASAASIGMQVAFRQSRDHCTIFMENTLSALVSILQEHRIFEPTADTREHATVSGMPAYRALAAEAERDYEGFWARLAREGLSWHKPFTKVL
ncbi:acetyl-coenzyme A synthetase N-terminal domain-containing protein, partial [Burkholderia latens]|uniref:acetyl-coenzyme A synthetase N-terminal domain-containing protein n=1 Tax=Burkholderia latens TaxID=488446 RepID=UPI0039655D59